MILKELTELNGVSGNEESVREYILNIIKDYCDEIKIDSIGNLIAFKKGRSSKHRIMLSAHMDEIGFIVTGYGENGTVKFNSVGGIDPRILPGKKVLIGEKQIPGVIGMKPIHLQEAADKEVNIKFKALYIDIGADKKEEAEKNAPLGEYIAFISEYVEMGDSCIKAKALDDRVGCAMIIEALKSNYEFDIFGCFTVQEEVGLRGSQVAANRVNPHLAIIIEGTTCSDVPGVAKHEYSTLLGEGAALTIMDRTTYSDKDLVDFIYQVGKKYKIPVQFKQTTTGGNDAGKIQQSGSGVKVASISVPCRYIHSPVSLMNKKDFESCNELLKKTLEELNTQSNLEKIIGGNINA